MHFNPDITPHNLLAIQLFEHKFRLTNSVELPPQFAVNKQSIFWTNLRLRYSMYKLNVPCCGSIVITTQSRFLAIMLGELKITYPGPDNCKKKQKLWHTSSELGFLILTVCNFTNCQLFRFRFPEFWMQFSRASTCAEKIRSAVNLTS
jgi:hypothetical protein